MIAHQSVYGGLLSGVDDNVCCPFLGQLSPQTRSMLGVGTFIVALLALQFIWR